MAVVFAIRGGSLTAHYSNDGASPGILGTTPAEITTDEPGINGTNSIDMVGVGAAGRALVYNGRLNTPSGLARSVLIRCKMASAAALGLFNMGVMTRNLSNYMGLNATSGGEVTFNVGNTGGASDTGTTTGAALGTTAFKDILMTWDGTGGSGVLDIYVDETNRLSDTPTRFLPSPFTASDRLAVSHIMLGSNFATINAHMSVDEFVVWDEVIDPTTVVLTTGTGLDGSARTAYVDIEALDGTVSAGGGGMLHLGRPGFS